MKKMLFHLNEENNFHLSLKAITCPVDWFFSVKEALEAIHYRIAMVRSQEDIYQQLKEIYLLKPDFILIDEKISFINPLYILLADCYHPAIRPYSKVIYVLHDNNQINTLKKDCQYLRAEMIKAPKVSFNKNISERDKENIIAELKKQLYSEKNK